MTTLLFVILFYVEENVQKGRDYIMSNKFELLEELNISAYQRDVEDGHEAVRIFQTINNVTHPVQAMVSISKLYRL